MLLLRLGLEPRAAARSSAPSYRDPCRRRGCRPSRGRGGTRATRSRPSGTGAACALQGARLGELSISSMSSSLPKSSLASRRDVRVADEREQLLDATGLRERELLSPPPPAKISAMRSRTCAHLFGLDRREGAVREAHELRPWLEAHRAARPRRPRRPRRSNVMSRLSQSTPLETRACAPHGLVAHLHVDEVVRDEAIPVLRQRARCPRSRTRSPCRRATTSLAVSSTLEAEVQQLLDGATSRRRRRGAPRAARAALALGGYERERRRKARAAARRTRARRSRRCSCARASTMSPSARS